MRGSSSTSEGGAEARTARADLFLSCGGLYLHYRVAVPVLSCYRLFRVHGRWRRRGIARARRDVYGAMRAVLRV